MSADIEFLNGVKASSEAVFHDALKRSTHKDRAIAIWMDDKHELHWSVNTTNQECLWMLEKMKGNVV